MWEENLRKIKLILPEPPKPAGAYIPAVRFENLIFISGQIPMVQGELRFKGKLGKEVTVKDGYQAARICAINALSVLKSELGGLDKVKRIVKLVGYVNSTSQFYDQPKVINGASDLLREVFDDDGMHARVAIGTNSLPLNACVEIELIAGVLL